MDDVIVGQAYQNGECANVGRYSLLAAGWPETITALTLDRRCCSGVDAVLSVQWKSRHLMPRLWLLAYGINELGRNVFPGAVKWGLGGRIDSKWGFMPNGHGALSIWGIPCYDRIQRARVMSQPVDRYGELNSMMSWAENAAKTEGISRQSADEWAVRSHQRAIEAQRKGFFDEEIEPIKVKGKKGKEIIFAIDETPRADASIDKLAMLKTVYPDGVCTAGNSSSENDGAAALVLASESKARSLGLKVLARLVAGAKAACDPTLTYPAVATAVKKALNKANLSIDDIDLFEIQEAFAVQLLADAKLMKIKREDYDRKINVNGSGISLGHPIGATGVMRLTTLLQQMKRQSSKHGLITICGARAESGRNIRAR